eukprot:6837628-Pyramimonas_sp.AAC.1
MESVCTMPQSESFYNVPQNGIPFVIRTKAILDTSHIPTTFPYPPPWLKPLWLEGAEPACASRACPS